ncbi:hypothetical protein QJS04_geneDACA016601 [Acorus gramineus]|uniref:Uncharacterized protein n=1 Tax=Acorus gramineus TaxID=55184 RepID=A0AAV9BKP8_ACOGR|nr:hypothetical protein QJS04_geneDACA016601 [Acorus gramineus]
MFKEGSPVASSRDLHHHLLFQASQALNMLLKLRPVGFTQTLPNLPFKPPNNNNNNKNHFHCRIQSKTHLDFILHDSLDASGIDTKHARGFVDQAAREGFERQIGGLSSAVERETSISINRGVDLGRAALQIAAEDDSLVSHSSVALPVDSFIERLDDLSTGFLSSPYAPRRGSPPEIFLESLERYFLPRGYVKQKSKQSDQQHIMTAQTHLVEMLRNLKDAFWPFQYDRSSSLFLRAARAANNVGGLCITDAGSSNSCNSLSGLEFASAKAAQHRLGRGVWTSVRYGDMRRALAACEHLILLDSDPRELRDYSVLLYHLGYYGESLQYLNLYQNSKVLEDGLN